MWHLQNLSNGGDLCKPARLFGQALLQLKELQAGNRAGRRGSGFPRGEKQPRSDFIMAHGVWMSGVRRGRNASKSCGISEFQENGKCVIV
jgi:hypothetical protein